MKQEDLIQQMNAYYDRRAPDHDRLMSYADNDTMEGHLRPLIELIVPHIADRKVLEIACGTGNWTQVLAKRARSVLATDINESTLEIARTKQYAGSVTFLRHDAYALDELKGVFDVALAADWWSHIPESMITTFVQRLHSRLSPGATVIMLDMTMRDAFLSEPLTIDQDGNRVYRRLTRDGREYPVVKNFPTESDLRKTIEDSAATIEYREFKKLERWLLIYQLKS